MATRSVEIGGLTISARGKDAEPVRGADGLRLNAEVRWFVEGPSDSISRLDAELAGVSERLRPTLLEVYFGNAVGQFSTSELGVVQVCSGKWDERHFSAMLNELTDVAAGLPYAAGGPGALPYDRSQRTGERLLYHAFVYLRHFLSTSPSKPTQLESAYAAILAEPHRELERTRRMARIDQANKLDPTGIHSLITRPKQWTKVENQYTRTMPVARALRGRLPYEVEQPETRVTLDTAENRFAKAFLAQMAGLVEDMRAAVSDEKPSAFTRRIQSDCETMANKLGAIRRASLWHDVGRMRLLPTGSTVLQRRRGYRQIFEHFSKLKLASRIPLDDDHVRDLLELKDIALLYELWSFFVVVDVVQSFCGPASNAVGVERDAFETTLAWDLSVEWTDGTRLSYNPRFSPTSRSGRRSYSVGLRPDIALEVPSGPNQGLHLFDAKFRLRALSDFVVSSEGSEDEDEIERQERSGKFKRADLYKMHTYRDAIPRARSVWILYPGTEARFFGSDGTSTWVLDQAGLPLKGVGAVPLQPASLRSDHVSVVIRELLT